jgi:hypothetical protein
MTLKDSILSPKVPTPVLGDISPSSSIIPFQYHSFNAPVFIHSCHRRYKFSVIYSVIKQHLQKLYLYVRNNAGEERIGVRLQRGSQ